MGQLHKRPSLEVLHDLISQNGDEWKAQGLCRKYPLPYYEDYWFPRPLTREAPPEAKQICGRCSVRRACLAYGLALDKQPGADTTGVYGGYVGYERRRLFARGIPEGRLP